MKKVMSKYLSVLMAMAIFVLQSDIYCVNVFSATKKTSAAILKQNSGKKSVKITWKKTSDVKKYVIYRSTSKNGLYKKIKTVKVNTKKGIYTDKNVKIGKTYFYRIKGKGLKISKVKKITVKNVGISSLDMENADNGNNPTVSSEVENPSPTPAVEQNGNDTTIDNIKDKIDGITNTENISDLNENIVLINKSTKLVVEGDINDKSIVCETDGIVLNVVLKNANVTNKTVPFILNKASGSEVIITAEEGTKNTVTAGKDYSNKDEVISSEGGLSFEGSGSIKIVNERSDINAVKSEKNLMLCAENLNIVSGKKGIVGEPVTVAGGTTTIDSVDDCIKAKGAKGFVMKDGKIKLTSEKDGIKSNKYISISGGILEIKAGDDGIQCGKSADDSSGDSSSEDKGYIEISDGTFIINSKDHGISANGDSEKKDDDFAIVITGGTFTVNTDATYTKQSTNAGGGWGRPGGGMEAKKTSYTSTGGDIINSDTGVKILGATIKSDKCNDGIQSEYSMIISDSTLNLSCYGKGLQGGCTINSESYGTIRLNSGTYNINSLDDAIHSNNEIDITGGNFTLATADDGIHADKTLKIGEENASDDNITITIEAGKVGNEAVTPYEGYESAVINIYSGKLSAIVSDDGINAAGGTDSSGNTGGNDPFRPGFGHGGSNTYGELNIYGGNIYLNTGGDSVDSNGKITMSAGILKIDGSNNGADDVIDWDSGFTLTGGEITAVGTAGVSTRVASNSSQRNVMFKGNRSSVNANTEYELKDSSGNVIVSGTTVRSCGVFYFTSEKFKNETYNLYIGGTKKATVTFTGASDGKTVSF